MECAAIVAWRRFPNGIIPMFCAHAAAVHDERGCSDCADNAIRVLSETRRFMPIEAAHQLLPAFIPEPLAAPL